MSSDSHELSSLTLSGGQVRALVAALAEYPASARERGRPYASGGRVGPLRFEPGAIGARVRGGESLYVVWWLWSGGRWAASCSCPVHFDCKHRYAVACCVLEPLRRDASRMDPRLTRLLPAEPSIAGALGLPDPRTRPKFEDVAEELDDDEDDDEFDDLEDDEAPAAPSSARRVSHPEPWWPSGADAPAGAPEPRAPGTLAALRRARDAWSRSLALRDLLGENPRVEVPLFDGAVREVLLEDDIDLMCWRLTRVLPRWTGDWLPEALDPYRDRADLAERYAARARTALAEEIARWTSDRRSAPERSLRFVVGLSRGAEGEPVLTLEARLSGRRLRDSARSLDQLDQLRREAERHPGLLSPLETELLSDFVSRPETWTAGHVNDDSLPLLRLLEIASDTPAIAWDEHLDPELSARAGAVPGAPLRFSPRRAAVVPVCESRASGWTLDLGLRGPDGRTRDLAHVLLLAGVTVRERHLPPMAICEGTVMRVGELPPASLLDLRDDAGGLPLDRRAHAGLLERLVQRFPSMRESLAPVTRLVPATPLIAMDVRDEGWLQLRLFAVPPHAAWRPVETPEAAERLHEYVPAGGWRVLEAATASGEARRFEPAAAAPEASATEAPAEPTNAGAATAPVLAPEDAWLERLDGEALEPAIEWLALTGAGDGRRMAMGGMRLESPDRGTGWWLPMTDRRLAPFAAAWDLRPPGIRWYCTAEVKRMLTEGREVRTRLRVESTGVDWFTVSAEWEAEGLSLTEEDLALLRRASGPYVRLSSGWVRRETGEAFEQAGEALADLGLEPGTGPTRLSVWQLAQADPQSLERLAALAADAPAIEAIRLLRTRLAEFRGVPAVPLPDGFRGTLRPYQQQGVEFLAFVSSLGMGSILADDMGLGKTVQALVWLLWLRRCDPELGPALVVCPASVVHNWEREAATFAPGLRVALLTSGGGRRERMREAANHDLLVTNYALLRRDHEAWRTVKLGAAILDEAQNIKNPDAGVSRAALALDARHRLALTGTPLENRALDLWSLMAFVNPGLLGARARFAARYDRADAGPAARRLLAARMRPVLLRRLKRDVAQDLPERIEERRDCDMHPGQRKLYLSELARSRLLVTDLAASPDGLAKNRMAILAALTRLRQICCHPALAGGASELGSGKFDALWEILEPLLAEGHKVLVFSQFVRCLDLIKAEMAARSIPHHVLTGQTVKRDQVVDRFQSDPRPAVFLVSLKAGGTGLNLTAASYVVLFDPWWNPAVEAQAIDRTHRIGQTRTVIAYRLLTLGTLEEKIWELQQRKAALARDVLGEDGFARTLTRDDLEYLLAPE